MPKIKSNLGHNLKRMLIKYRLWSFIENIYEPVYVNLIRLSPAKRRYRQQMIDFYSNFIKEGDLCFDVGAHMGNRVEIFLRLGAKVIAIEPQEKCVNYLKKRFGNNPNFVLVEKGLADREGKLPLSICEEANSISTFSEKWKEGRFSEYQWGSKKIVQVTTLDNLIKEFGMPVFCKIDVEGFETQVLRGLSSPIKCLSFEFTKEFFDEAKVCLDYLISLGYSLFNYDIYESMNLQFPEWVMVEELIGEIEKSKNQLLGGDIYAKI